MLHHQIYSYETNQIVATQVADRIYQLHKTYLNESKNLHLAISGGSTPKILFELLAKEYGKKIDWRYISVYWVDERCVPHTDAQSNYKMTHDAWLSKVPIPSQNIYPIQGDSEPNQEATRYAQLLKKNVPQQGDYPQFDLLLLGMGDDGHTASIFPHQMELLDVAQTVATAQHPLTAQQRITLTGKTILQAKQIFFIITGKDKAERLSEIVNENEQYAHYPTYYILKNSSAKIFADNQATALL